MRPTRICAAAVLAAALTIAGCGGSSTNTASTPSSAATSSAGTPAAAPAVSGPTTVNITNYIYGPPAATVKAGTRVTFANHDATAHTATATGSPSFDTGTIKAGAQATVILSKPGTYSYICQFHPFMKGTITVS